MSEAKPLSTIVQQFSDDSIDGAADADNDNDDDDGNNVDRFAKLVDTSLTEVEMERYFNGIFQQNFTVREVKKYLERKVLQIEGRFLNRFNDMRDRLNFDLSDEDQNSLVLIESCLVHIHRVICCVLYDGVPLSIILPCESSATYVSHTPDGVMFPTRVNSNQSIDTPQKALFYGFILTHYYGAMLAHVESVALRTDSGDLRYIFYLNKLVCCGFQTVHRRHRISSSDVYHNG